MAAVEANEKDASSSLSLALQQLASEVEEAKKEVEVPNWFLCPL